MTSFLIYPAIDDDHSFPPEVNQAIADSPEVQAEFMSRTELNATYATAFSDAQAITYNSDGSVATVTDSGITTIYTYNSDGTVATDSRTINGVTTTRNYGYTNGNLTSITKAA